MRILVCEDQDAIRHMIQTLVEASGHEVVGVALGAQAVERARAEPFHLLILDLMLPGTLDGFGVIEHIRADEATRALPIMVITALAAPARSSWGQTSSTASPPAPSSCSTTSAASNLPSGGWAWNGGPARATWGAP